MRENTLPEVFQSYKVATLRANDLPETFADDVVKKLHDAIRRAGPEVTVLFVDNEVHVSYFYVLSKPAVTALRGSAFDVTASRPVQRDDVERSALWSLMRNMIKNALLKAGWSRGELKVSWAAEGSGVNPGIRMTVVKAG